MRRDPPFHVYQPDIDPAIKAEFAHAVYRFGHSMLDDDVARRSTRPRRRRPTTRCPCSPRSSTRRSTSPAARPGRYTPEQAAGSVVMGSSDQAGNEIDEFVTETLRNNLLGLPLDLAAINIARARERASQPLNDVRRRDHASDQRQPVAPTRAGRLRPAPQAPRVPGQLRRRLRQAPEHPRRHDGDGEARRGPGDRRPPRPATYRRRPTPTPSCTGPAAWSATPRPDHHRPRRRRPVGRRAGRGTNLNGGLLGSTVNYVFENQLENLQSGDRLYYLNRTPGMNLRTQLEGNSFAEMIMRNTDGTQRSRRTPSRPPTAGSSWPTSTAPRPASRPTARPSADDPTTECDECMLLLRKPGRHDRVPHQQHGRPERHQRPGRLQRDAGRRPGQGRQRQRHLLGRRERRRHRRQRRRRRGARGGRQRHHHRPRRCRHPQGRTRRRRDRRRPGDDITARWGRADVINGGAGDNESSPDPATTSSSPARAPTPSGRRRGRLDPGRRRPGPAPATTRRRSSTTRARSPRQRRVRRPGRREQVRRRGRRRRDGENAAVDEYAGPVASTGRSTSTTPWPPTTTSRSTAPSPGSRRPWSQPRPLAGDRGRVGLRPRRRDPRRRHRAQHDRRRRASPAAT